MPGYVNFDGEEIDRIQRAQLILNCHIQPSEIDAMSDEEKWDVLAIWEAQEALKAGKVPGYE